MIYQGLLVKSSEEVARTRHGSEKVREGQRRSEKVREGQRRLVKVRVEKVREGQRMLEKEGQRKCTSRSRPTTTRCTFYTYYQVDGFLDCSGFPSRGSGGVLLEELPFGSQGLWDSNLRIVEETMCYWVHGPSQTPSLTLLDPPEPSRNPPQKLPTFLF